MKRDIFFDEFTPLSYKEEDIKSPHILPLVFLFEVLLVAFGCIVFPRIEETCTEAPLMLWITVLVIIVNMHLLCAAVENFWQKYGTSAGFPGLHYAFTGMIMVWMAYGHYVVFYEGIECFGSQIYMVCTIILGFLDLSSAILTAVFTWYSVGKSW